MNVWYSGFSMDNTENNFMFCLFFYNWFSAPRYFIERQRKLWKIKNFGLYFSHQKHFDLMFCFLLSWVFFSMLRLQIFFSPICVLFYGKGWRQHCKLYHQHPVYGPMHLHGVCMNGSLSNWHTMLHYTSQWGSMQVR